MPRSVHIATLQPEIRWGRPLPNMVLLRGLVDRLPASVDVVVLPEAWNGLSSRSPEVAEYYEKSLQFLSTLARTKGVAVVGGSIQRRDGGAFQTVCLVLDANGEIIAEYVKRVLFASEQDDHVAGSGSAIVEIGGVRIGVMICADLWRSGLTAELQHSVDLLTVCTRTGVPSDRHVDYGRTLWQSMSLTRAMEFGIPVVVSDWPNMRHAAIDVDRTIGSAHASGMVYDSGDLRTRGKTQSGPHSPTATLYTSATPALGAGVHFTCGAATICDPGHRPDIQRIQSTLLRGEPGVLNEIIDLEQVAAYRAYRIKAGLMVRPD